MKPSIHAQERERKKGISRRRGPIIETDLSRRAFTFRRCRHQRDISPLGIGERDDVSFPRFSALIFSPYIAAFARIFPSPGRACFGEKFVYRVFSEVETEGGLIDLWVDLWG